jgi:hypothetical protein
MNPLHLEILTNTRIADRRRVASRTVLERAAQAASRPTPDEDGPLQPRMPRGPRLRVRPPVVARVRSLRLLFGGAVV